MAMIWMGLAVFALITNNNDAFWAFLIIANVYAASMMK